MHHIPDIAARNIAYTAGLRAALEPADPEIVPTEYRFSDDLADAWTAGYRSVSTALCNQRPGVMDAGPAPKKLPRTCGGLPREPREKKAKQSRHLPRSSGGHPAQIRPSMMAILDEQLT